MLPTLSFATISLYALINVFPRQRKTYSHTFPSLQRTLSFTWIHYLEINQEHRLPDLHPYLNLSFNLTLRTLVLSSHWRWAPRMWLLKKKRDLCPFNVTNSLTHGHKVQSIIFQNIVSICSETAGSAACERTHSDRLGDEATRKAFGWWNKKKYQLAGWSWRINAVRLGGAPCMANQTRPSSAGRCSTLSLSVLQTRIHLLQSSLYCTVRLVSFHNFLSYFPIFCFSFFVSFRPIFLFFFLVSVVWQLLIL